MEAKINKIHDFENLKSVLEKSNSNLLLIRYTQTSGLAQLLLPQEMRIFFFDENGLSFYREFVDIKTEEKVKVVAKIAEKRGIIFSGGEVHACEKNGALYFRFLQLPSEIEGDFADAWCDLIKKLPKEEVEVVGFADPKKAWLIAKHKMFHYILCYDVFSEKNISGRYDFLEEYQTKDLTESFKLFLISAS